MKTIYLLFGLLLLAACNGPSGSDPGPPAPAASYAAPDPSAGLGSELAGDPGMEVYAGGLCDSWQSDGSVQAARSTDPHGGSYAQQVRLSCAGGTPSNQSADIWTIATVSPGQWYRASFWAKRVAGTAGDVVPWIYAPGGGLSYLAQPITGGAYARYLCTAQATASALLFGVNNGPSSAASDTVVIDDVSIRAIPFASMVSLRDGGSRYGKASARITMQKATQAGVVFCADSASNPQNYLLAYHDGAQIHFFKVLAGAYSSLPVGDDALNYRADRNPAVAYVPGAALEIQRAPGSDLFSVYYNGRYVWQQAVTDPALVNNTVHGLFSSFEANQVDFSFNPASVVKKIVFLGGSITNGAGATAQNGWQWLLRDYLDTSHADISWSYSNAAAGGTDSWYSLIRLQSDALANAPDIIFVDEAVNDMELAPSNPAWPYVGEALIRRIRTALPHCKIVICNFMRPAGSDTGPDPDTETVRAAWNRIASYYQCDLYRMDTGLLGVLPARPTTAQIDAYFSAPGNVHPNDRGHALIFSGISGAIDLLAENGWTGNLAGYARLGAYTEEYESAPTILSGSELLAQKSLAGVWSPANAGCSGAGTPAACCTGSGTGSCSGASSAAAGSTLSFTGGMVMAGLDVVLQNGSWPAGLQYSLDGGAWTTLVPQNSPVSDSEFMFVPGARAAHTLCIRLSSGTVTINRLLVL